MSLWEVVGTEVNSEEPFAPQDLAVAGTPLGHRGSQAGTQLGVAGSDPDSPTVQGSP